MGVASDTREDAMRQQEIEVGFQAFIDDDAEEFGAIRYITPDGRDLTVYVENAGDFVVSRSAVISVEEEKVTFACDKLDARLREAIGHAHDAEDPEL
jgi:hypothetical protein